MSNEMNEHLLNPMCLLIAALLKDKGIVDPNNLTDEYCKVRDFVTGQSQD